MAISIKAITLGCLAGLVLAAPAGAQIDTDPGTAEWQQVARDRMIADCGMDPDLLDQAKPKLTQTPFVVIRHGRLCWEGGYPTGSTEPYSVYSVTKTFGALLVGMVDSRSGLDDTDTVTDWIAQADLGAINPKAKIAHVLAMVSTNADLGPGKKGAWSYDTFGDREINKLEGAMNKAIAAEPGSFPGAKNIVEFAQKELFDPLGMKVSTWPGGGIASNLKTSVRDMARLGQLVLQRGRWSGRQILDEDFVYKMTHPAFEDVNTGYGYLTYSNAAKGWSYPTSTADTNCSPYSQWPRYPHRPFFESYSSNGGVPEERRQPYDMGTTFASGTGGQKFIIYRGLDMVIAVRDSAVAVGESGAAVDQFPGHKTIWNALRPAMLAVDKVFKGDETAFCAAFRRSEYAPTLREPWSVGVSLTAQEAACVSKRVLTITVPKPRGMKVRKVFVELDGTPVAVTRGKRTTAVIDLRGRPPGAAIVRIRIAGTRRGKPAVSRQTRAFRTCVAPAR
jgi:CubicO group peptidase (beta-lactamase class C family)